MYKTVLSFLKGFYLSFVKDFEKTKGKKIFLSASKLLQAYWFVVRKSEPRIV
jgi:hypothetical protein